MTLVMRVHVPEDIEREGDKEDRDDDDDNDDVDGTDNDHSERRRVTAFHVGDPCSRTAAVAAPLTSSNIWHVRVDKVFVRYAG